jgi:hypothetical protein
MVAWGMAALDTGLSVLFDHGLEIAEIEVFEHSRQIARRPRFAALCIDLLDTLESVAGPGNWQ